MAIKNSKRPAGKSSPAEIKKTPTYIPGLDEILRGGLPKSRTAVVNGSAGSGKTVLGLEFIYRGALAGEPGIFVCFEETPGQLRENAATMGWDIPALEDKNLIFLYDGTIKPEVIMSGSFSLKGLLAAITGKKQEINATRIVIDALDVIFRFFDSPTTVRNELHMLNDWLNEEGMTTILTVRPSNRPDAVAYEEFFESMGDCVIRMDARVMEQVTTRRLRVIKYRGSDFERNEYPYVITGTGLHAAPISTVGLKHKPLGRKMSTGNKELDKILKGGYSKGSCILFAGEPGTGKTILVSTFIEHACKKGDKILYIGFEESEDALVNNVFNAGINLRPHISAGKLLFITNYPEAMGAEEHYIRAVKKIDMLKPAHVVVDAISACLRMGGKLAAFEYLMRLLNYCKEQGITILLINQLSGSSAYLEISGNSISSMIDTVIYMKYVMCPGETNRVLQVLKSRGSGHSNQKHEYVITDNGIKILEIYTGRGEMLTGTARTEKEEEEKAEAEKIEYEISRTELELKRLKQIQNRVSKESKLRMLKRGGEYQA